VENVIFFYTPAELKKVYSHLIFGFLQNNIAEIHVYKQCLQQYRFVGIWVYLSLLKILMKRQAQISLFINMPKGLYIGDRATIIVDSV
jgi:hypothetical protein